MPSWFDMMGFSTSVLLDETKDPAKGIVESANSIKEILRDECKLIDSSKVFVGGFSQGACVACEKGKTCAVLFFFPKIPLSACWSLVRSVSRRHCGLFWMGGRVFADQIA